jgi:hypothetical protein
VPLADDDDVSVLSKTYYAEQTQPIDPTDVYMVAIMPCVAKKFESRRPEHTPRTAVPYTDAVLTTRELIWMLKAAGIDFWTLENIDISVYPEQDVRRAARHHHRRRGDLRHDRRRHGGDAPDRRRETHRPGPAQAGVHARCARRSRASSRPRSRSAGRQINVGVANGTGNAAPCSTRSLAGRSSSTSSR